MSVLYGTGKPPVLTRDMLAQRTFEEAFRDSKAMNNLFASCERLLAKDKWFQLSNEEADRIAEWNSHWHMLSVFDAKQFKAQWAQHEQQLQLYLQNARALVRMANERSREAGRPYTPPPLVRAGRGQPAKTLTATMQDLNLSRQSSTASCESVHDALVSKDIDGRNYVPGFVTLHTAMSYPMLQYNVPTEFVFRLDTTQSRHPALSYYQHLGTHVATKAEQLRQRRLGRAPDVPFVYHVDAWNDARQLYDLGVTSRTVDTAYDLTTFDTLLKLEQSIYDVRHPLMAQFDLTGRPGGVPAKYSVTALPDCSPPWNCVLSDGLPVHRSLFALPNETFRPTVLAPLSYERSFWLPSSLWTSDQGGPVARKMPLHPVDNVRYFSFFENTPTPANMTTAHIDAMYERMKSHCGIKYITRRDFAGLYMGPMQRGTKTLPQAIHDLQNALLRPFGEPGGITIIDRPERTSAAIKRVHQSLMQHGFLGLDQEFQNFPEDSLPPAVQNALQQIAAKQSTPACQQVLGAELRKLFIDQQLYLPAYYCAAFNGPPKPATVAWLQIATPDGEVFVFSAHSLVQPGTLHELLPCVYDLLCNSNADHVKDGCILLWSGLLNDEQAFKRSFGVDLAPNHIDVAKLFRPYNVNVQQPDRVMGPSISNMTVLLAGRQHESPPFAVGPTAVDTLASDPRFQQWAREQSVRNATTTHRQEDFLFTANRVFQQGVFRRSELLDLQSTQSRAWLYYAAQDAQIVLQSFMVLVQISPELSALQCDRLARAVEGAARIIDNSIPALTRSVGDYQSLLTAVDTWQQRVRADQQAAGAISQTAYSVPRLQQTDCSQIDVQCEHREHVHAGDRDASWSHGPDESAAKHAGSIESVLDPPTAPSQCASSSAKVESGQSASAVPGMSDLEIEQLQNSLVSRYKTLREEKKRGERAQTAALRAGVPGPSAAQSATVSRGEQSSGAAAARPLAPPHQRPGMSPADKVEAQKRERGYAAYFAGAASSSRGPVAAPDQPGPSSASVPPNVSIRLMQVFADSPSTASPEKKTKRVQVRGELVTTYHCPFDLLTTTITMVQTALNHFVHGVTKALKYTGANAVTKQDVHNALVLAATELRGNLLCFYQSMTASLTEEQLLSAPPLYYVADQAARRFALSAWLATTDPELPPPVSDYGRANLITPMVERHQVMNAYRALLILRGPGYAELPPRCYRIGQTTMRLATGSLPNTLLAIKENYVVLPIINVHAYDYLDTVVAGRFLATNFASTLQPPQPLFPDYFGLERINIYYQLDHPPPLDEQHAEVYRSDVAKDRVDTRVMMWQRDIPPSHQAFQWREFLEKLVEYHQQQLQRDTYNWACSRIRDNYRTYVQDWPFYQFALRPTYANVAWPSDSAILQQQPAMPAHYYADWHQDKPYDLRFNVCTYEDYQPMIEHAMQNELAWSERDSPAAQQLQAGRQQLINLRRQANAQLLARFKESGWCDQDVHVNSYTGHIVGRKEPVFGLHLPRDYTAQQFYRAKQHCERALQTALVERDTIHVPTSFLQALLDQQELEAPQVVEPPAHAVILPLEIRDRLQEYLDREPRLPIPAGWLDKASDCLREARTCPAVTSQELCALHLGLNELGPLAEPELIRVLYLHMVNLALTHALPLPDWMIPPFLCGHPQLTNATEIDLFDAGELLVSWFRPNDFAPEQVAASPERDEQGEQPAPSEPAQVCPSKPPKLSRLRLPDRVLRVEPETDPSWVSVLGTHTGDVIYTNDQQCTVHVTPELAECLRRGSGGEDFIMRYQMLLKFIEHGDTADVDADNPFDARQWPVAPMGRFTETQWRQQVPLYRKVYARMGNLCVACWTPHKRTCGRLLSDQDASSASPAAAAAACASTSESGQVSNGRDTLLQSPAQQERSGNVARRRRPSHRGSGAVKQDQPQFARPTEGPSGRQ